jgi:putative flippase GtrA
MTDPRSPDDTQPAAADACPLAPDAWLVAPEPASVVAGGRPAAAATGPVAAASRFAVVGAISAVIDFGAFNLLHFGVGIGPLTAKTVAVAAATLFSYVGNRFWAFGHRRSAGHLRDIPVFAALNGVGLLIALAVLAAVRYGLGLTSPLALNVLGNGGGILLAMIFRFWSYQIWVFRPPRGATPVSDPTATHR